jgi:hypothetical protein
MRYCLFFMFSMVFFGAFGQNFPIKRDNVILVKSDSSAAVLHKLILKALAKGEWVVERTDYEVLTVSTDWKNLRRGTDARLHVFVETDGNGSKAIVRGDLRTPELGESRIDFRGMKGSPALDAWEALDGFSKILGGLVSYGKK